MIYRPLNRPKQVPTIWLSLRGRQTSRAGLAAPSRGGIREEEHGDPSSSKYLERGKVEFEPSESKHHGYPRRYTILICNVFDITYDSHHGVDTHVACTFSYKKFIFIYRRQGVTLYAHQPHLKGRWNIYIQSHWPLWLYRLLWVINAHASPLKISANFTAAVDTCPQL